MVALIMDPISRKENGVLFSVLTTSCTQAFGNFVKHAYFRTVILVGNRGYFPIDF